jgi:hypothetical protein
MHGEYKTTVEFGHLRVTMSVTDVQRILFPFAFGKSGNVITLLRMQAITRDDEISFLLQKLITNKAR